MNTWTRNIHNTGRCGGEAAMTKHYELWPWKNPVGGKNPKAQASEETASWLKAGLDSKRGGGASADTAWRALSACSV